MFSEECGTDDPYAAIVDSLLDNTTENIASLRDAISQNDEQAVRRISKSFRGYDTLIPKRDAINKRKPQILKILLSEDDTVDESLMAAACESRQRDVISALVEHGWPINRPLSLNMSPLWSVQVTSQRSS